MDDAKLNMRLGIYAVYGIGEALQAIDTGNQDILKTPIFQFSQDIKPELRAFIFRYPHAQQFLLTFGINTQHEENGFVNDRTVVTNLYHDTLKINNGIERLQGPILPLAHLLFNPVGDFRYQRRRDISIVHFFKCGDDLTGRHTFGVKGQNLAVYLCNTRLVFLYELRLEGIFTVTWRVQLDFAVIAQKGFG